jgi:subtilisin family serine protease
MVRRIRRRSVVALAAAVAVTGAAAFGFLAGPSALAAVNPPEGDIRSAGGADAVTGSYLVVLKDAQVSARSGAAAKAAVDDSAQRLTKRHGGAVRHRYSAALHGFEARVSEKEARRIAADPAVEYVEQDHLVRVTDTQVNPPSYGLDRIDQPALPLDHSYTYPSTGSDVTVFVIDTGIRFSHKDFGGRAVPGFDYERGSGDDCDGHGTHVAGTIGGASYGVAKRVKLVAVRVLDCQGSGRTADVIAGIDYVTSVKQAGIGAAVANMSLGGGASAALDAAVKRSIAAGVTYAVAAGNENTTACNSSPARVPAAITVAATDRTDRRASFSNFGRCVDIFAPGVRITSAYNTSDRASADFSGTSQATPHVAGVAALILQANPTATPDQVSQQLAGTAARNRITDPGSGTPNRLLQVPR